MITNAPTETANEGGQVINPKQCADPESVEQPLPSMENSDHTMDVNYVFRTESEDRVDIDNVNFSYHVAKTLLDAPDPADYAEARASDNWPEWEQAMKTELASLHSRKVFGEVQEKPKGMNTVGYRWVFATKRNSEGEIIRYKARLVAKGFSQKFGTDYEATYSPVMDATTFRFLTGFATHMALHMQMMDVVTAYLYGNLDKDIYMKIPDGVDFNVKDYHRPCVKLKRSLYGLKQSGRMWYQRLSNFLISKGFVVNEISPCVFIKRVKTDFAVILVYVDDLNIIGTMIACKEAAKALRV
jgi:hypothetical protein